MMLSEFKMTDAMTTLMRLKSDLLATIAKKKREVKRGGNNRTGRPPGSRNIKKEDPEQS